MQHQSPQPAIELEAPRSRAEQLAQSLTASIHARQLTAGDRFGTLEEIREEVGLARTTVSEAVRLLRERGVLEIRPGRSGGLFIAAETPVVRMRHTLIRVTAGERSIREAVELREALELPIALSAATQCTPEAAEHLRTALNAMEETTNNFAQFLKHNWQLHETIAALSDNAMMRAVYTSCLGYLTRSETQHHPEAPPQYVQTRIEVHRSLVQAIIAGDHTEITRAVARHNHGEEESV